MLTTPTGDVAAASGPSWATPPPLPPPPRTGRGIVVRIATGVAVAVALALLGHRTAAIVLVTVSSVVLVVSLRAPRAAAAIDRLTARFQHLVGRLLTTVILSAIFLAVFVPVAAVLRLVRHDPLALGSSDSDPSFWRTAAPRRNRPLDRRPFTDERHPPVVRAGGGRAAGGPLLRLRAALGLLVLLAAADVGAGAVIDRLVVDADEIEAQPVSLRTPDVGAREGEPWAQGLFDELARSYDATVYHPFRGWTVPDFDGENLHVTDEVRRSYQSPAIGSGPAVEVQFFGGSTTMGWFQRDEHTIASEFARLAEADGIPVRVVNYGQPAYQNWQEVLLLQEVVTRGDAPDLAVFYDGANELGAQFQAGPSDDPIHLQSRAIEDRLEASSDAAATSSGSALRRMYDAYADTSAVHRVAGSAPSGITGSEIQDTGPMASPWPDQEVRPEERGRAAARLHRRGVDLAQSLGDGFDFEVAFFWQPFIYTRDTAVDGEEEVVGSWGTDPASWTVAYDAARADLHPSVVDISDVYAGVEEAMYYDFVHTNERGAALVARAMYDQLRAQLERLHEAAG